MCHATSVVRERSWFALTSCWWNSRTSFQCQTCTFAGGSSPGARRSAVTFGSRGATPKNSVAPSSDQVGVRYAATRSPAGNDRSFEKSYTCFVAAAPTPRQASTAYAVSANALSACCAWRRDRPSARATSGRCRSRRSRRATGSPPFACRAPGRRSRCGRRRRSSWRASRRRRSTPTPRRCRT